MKSVPFKQLNLVQSMYKFLQAGFLRHEDSRDNEVYSL